MINCKNASDRLKSSPEMLKMRFEKLGIDDQMLMWPLTELEEISLVQFLNAYIVKFTIEDLEKLLGEYLYLQEILLKLTCLSGKVENMEAIYIILKIVKNKHQQVC